ncbi:hypothetical protein MtrunA17_Chr2g0287801 [Medicago truncatula]|uniref:Transmembrane protein n=1 Tax=Medicago truncatula TaxID=3880 RepID=A0A396J576_MEDTR|nr:hypothetical protein MtrunA17_Chr2g0287801 [Medicago truncatula]
MSVWSVVQFGVHLLFCVWVWEFVLVGVLRLILTGLGVVSAVWCCDFGVGCYYTFLSMY